MTLSTHVLDTSQGRPAAGVRVRWERRAPDGWRGVAAASTDADGRITADAWDAQALPGEHRLIFDIAGYQGPDAFFPEVSIVFRMGEGHHHVPLLLSPYGYTTYRGS